MAKQTVPGDWAQDLLTKLAPATRLSKLDAGDRTQICNALRIVAAHKAYAYGRAYRGEDLSAGTRKPMPRLENAIALLHHHLLDVCGVPILEDPCMLDALAQAVDGVPPTATDSATPVLHNATSSIVVQQGQLF